MKKLRGVHRFLLLLCLAGPCLDLAAEDPKAKADDPLARACHRLLAAPENNYRFSESRDEFLALTDAAQGAEDAPSRYFVALICFLDGDQEKAYQAAVKLCQVTEGKRARSAAAMGRQILDVRAQGHLSSPEILKGILYELSTYRIPFPVDRGPNERFFNEDDLVNLFLFIEILKKAELNPVLLEKARAAISAESRARADKEALDELESDDDSVASLLDGEKGDGREARDWRQVARTLLAKTIARLSPCDQPDFLAAAGILAVHTAQLEADFPGLRQLVVRSVSALQLRQIALAMYLHVLDHKGALPQAWRQLKESGAVGTWQGALCPYLGIDVLLDYKNVQARIGPRWELLPYDSVFVHPAAVRYAPLRRIYADMGAYELLLKSEDHMRRFERMDHAGTLVAREKPDPQGNKVNCLYLDGTVCLK
jgi:hypothetical protein